MNNFLRIVVALPAIGFLVIGLRWAIDPSTAASDLGMTLLSGLGRSSQIADVGALFLSMGQHDLDRPDHGATQLVLCPCANAVICGRIAHASLDSARCRISIRHGYRRNHRGLRAPIGLCQALSGVMSFDATQ